VIYESFAYGKPVIASKMGGMPELVEHRKNGLLFEAGDVATLTEQCRELWEKPETAEQYGRAGRAKAEEQFEPQVHYEKIVAWYQEMLNGRNGRD
jgi:glycosyltransferase involved in cell wall biosynthesis